MATKKLNTVGFLLSALAALVFIFTGYLSTAHAFGNITNDDAEFMAEMGEFLRLPDELDLNLDPVVTTPVIPSVAPSVSPSANKTIQTSAALRTVFDQAEKTYMVHIYDLNMQVALNESPDMLATHVGLVLQRQKSYLNQYPGYSSQFRVLRDETLGFLRQLARAHHYQHPTYGSELSIATIEGKFYEALNGNMNEFYIGMFQVDPANVNLPFILNQIAATNN